MKILLVEDEVALSNLITEALTRELFTVDRAYDGEEAKYKVLNFSFDVIILDILLPKCSGWEVLKEIRKVGLKSPVLMLTALSQVEDKVKGLNIGADDYLAKPFDIRELVARLQALIRRSNSSVGAGEILTCGDLEVEIATRTVNRDKIPIDLTKKEFQILQYLLYHKGEVVTKEMLEEHLWSDEDELWSDVIRSHMKNLRKKLDIKHKKSLIKTVRGEGYVLSEE